MALKAAAGLKGIQSSSANSYLLHEKASKIHMCFHKTDLSQGREALVKISFEPWELQPHPSF